jgi:predicted house-cleaning noncanonical NTP pyrophosphatase (MazG superfamily)
MPSFLFNKIIREKFLERLTCRNGSYTSTTLTKEEILKELKLKLNEEAKETLLTQTTQALLEELSDLLEVMEAILETLNLSMSDLSAAKAAKELARGKLKKDEKILVVNVPLTTYFEDVISYLRENPERYPEL